MPTPGSKLGWRSRLALVLGALGLSGSLVIVRWLEPDPRGFGTHTGLGLPPCSFQARTGKNCPGCGLTTAMSWMVRGRISEAWRAHPVGTLLGPLCLAIVPWMLVSAGSGRPRWGARTVLGPLVGFLVAILALCLLAWTLRMLLE
ncbi:DUF2752 domain-containing protein [soil metagenome]